MSQKVYFEARTLPGATTSVLEKGWYTYNWQVANSIREIPLKKKEPDGKEHEILIMKFRTL